MPNQDVLAGAVEKLQAQVTQDAPLREAWMKDLKKHHRDLTALRARLLRASCDYSVPIDDFALEWARTGQLPQSRPGADTDMQISILRERIHRAHIFAKWLEVSGCQICGADDKKVLAWLLTDFWKLYGQSAWLETIASSV